MKEILLKGPLGERWIKEGENFRFLPGEVVAEDEKGNSIIRGGSFNLQDNLQDSFTGDGLLIGNVIKNLTSALGIRQCLKCKQRQLRYNQKGLEIQQKIKKVIGL